MKLKMIITREDIEKLNLFSENEHGVIIRIDTNDVSETWQRLKKEDIKKEMEDYNECT